MLEGRSIPARAGEPVAASLWASGESVLSRSPKYHRPRGAFCFTGACSHCLMRIDGAPDRFSCRVPAREGLQLERQNGYPSVEFDLAASVELAFPRRLDHHHLMVSVPVARTVAAKVARRMAGLGRLPDPEVDLEVAPLERLATEVAIVGAGPAGRAVARELQRLELPFLLLERTPDAIVGPSVVEAEALGLYSETSGRFLLARRQPFGGAPSPSLVRVEAHQFVLALGGHASLPPFENNDRPGILTARAASLLLEKHRLVVGREVVVAAEPGTDAPLLAARLRATGSRVTEVPIEAIRGALGRSALKGVRLGSDREISCDALVLSTRATPSYELAIQGGARLAPDASCTGAYRLVCDQNGKTDAADLWVAGLMAGARDEASAVASGEAVARAIVQHRAGRP